MTSITLDIGYNDALSIGAEIAFAGRRQMAKTASDAHRLRNIARKWCLRERWHNTCMAGR